MVLEHGEEYAFRAAAIKSIAETLGWAPNAAQLGGARRP